MRRVFVSIILVGLCSLMPRTIGAISFLPSAPVTIASGSAAPGTADGMTDYMIDGKPVSRARLWFEITKLACGIPVVLFVIFLIAWRIHTDATTPISKHGGRAASPNSLQETLADDAFPDPPWKP